MKIMVTGAAGMLGRTLMRTLEKEHYECLGVDLADFDLTNLHDTQQAVDQFAPDLIIHGAAMTQVDLCETECDLAWRVNVIGSAHAAIAAYRAGARIIALSTDYVFPGTSDRPYNEWDATDPASVYGQTKCAGEDAIRAHNPDHAICRISWLYGQGGPSFVHTILRLARETEKPLKIVADQIGNPTSCDAVADALLNIVKDNIPGTIHLTCEGETSWKGLAEKILQINGLDTEVLPCTTAEFPRPAPRPANSRLEKMALRLHGLSPMPDWEDALQHFFDLYPEG